MNTSRAFSYRSFAIAALSGALLVGCQQEIISHNPQSRAQGISDFEQGNYADAAGSFRNALRSDPRDYRSAYYLAQCYENLKQ
jgi:Tfp pilus assembly protein PilF